MKNFRSAVLKEAYERGGFRERYAMDFGKKKTVTISGHRCYKFTYSEKDTYQDANGATYDPVKKEWVN